MEKTMPGKIFYRNGWVVGALVAAAISLAFLALFRESYEPFVVMLVVGLPIGIAVGVFAGLLVEYPTIPRERMYMIGLATLASFLLYVILLFMFLMHRVG